VTRVTLFTPGPRALSIAARRADDVAMASVILVAALIAAALASTVASARLGR
jgi:hypothetical protein